MGLGEMGQNHDDDITSFEGGLNIVIHNRLQLGSLIGGRTQIYVAPQDLMHGQVCPREVWQHVHVYMSTGMNKLIK